jgi:cytochrome c oxidase subunit 2
MESTTILHPGSPGAKEILHLFYIMLGIAAGIFVIVAGLTLYSSYRFRDRRRHLKLRPGAESKMLEVLWTAVPILVVTYLFFKTVRVMHEVNPPPRGGDPDLVVIAHQWWWELHYPKSGAVSANEIHLPVGRRELLRLESADVVHDFWVPALGKKVDAIPNHPNHLWITLSKPGTFLGTCDEYCGSEHAWMRIRVIGQEPAAFKNWISRQLLPAPAPSGAEARKGASIFQARTCANCHTIAGTESAGNVGPDLTHVASRETLASGAIENSPENLKRWIKNPQAIKPGCHMPNLRLSDSELKALAAYLGGLE